MERLGPKQNSFRNGCMMLHAAICPCQRDARRNACMSNAFEESSCALSSQRALRSDGASTSRAIPSWSRLLATCNAPVCHSPSARFQRTRDFGRLAACIISHRATNSPCCNGSFFCNAARRMVSRRSVAVAAATSIVALCRWRRCFLCSNGAAPTISQACRNPVRGPPRPRRLGRSRVTNVAGAHGAHGRHAAASTRRFGRLRA